MLAHFQELKAQMNKVRDNEKEKLTKVTLESNAAIKEIKRQKDKVLYMQSSDIICSMKLNCYENNKLLWRFSYRITKTCPYACNIQRFY